MISTMEDFRLRTMEPGDGASFSALAEAAPDGGLVTFFPRYLIDPYTHLVCEDPATTAVVVTHPEHPGIVGAGLVTLLDAYLGGTLHRAAYLSSLLVHPRVRRRGVATRIAAWRIQHARAQAGDDVVIFANIQQGNTASEGNAYKWATQFLPGPVVTPLPVLPKPPANPGGWAVRPAEDAELPQLAERANTFYAEYNLHVPVEEAHKAMEPPHTQWMVAVDENGEIAAGVVLQETFRESELVVQHMPLAIRMANVFLKAIPPDGVLKQATLSYLWYVPGAESAARYLVKRLRHDWRNACKVLVFTYDRRSPLHDLLDITPWQPTTALNVALYSPQPVDEHALVNPFLRFKM